MNFVFSRPSQFSYSCMLSFVVCILLLEQKKINLANLKLLVRLDILSPLESDHFPEKRLVLKRMSFALDQVLLSLLSVSFQLEDFVAVFRCCRKREK